MRWPCPISPPSSTRFKVRVEFVSIGNREPSPTESDLSAIGFESQLDGKTAKLLSNCRTMSRMEIRRVGRVRVRIDGTPCSMMEWAENTLVRVSNSALRRLAKAESMGDSGALTSTFDEWTFEPSIAPGGRPVGLCVGHGVSS
jgi:hypothetical protein